MKTKFTAVALILASGLIAGTSALAEVTRQQVKAELAEAVRTGDIMAGGESSLKLNELYSNSHPTGQVQAGLTREQVKAELAEATRTGDFMEGGEINVKHIEFHPNHHLHAANK